MNIKTRIKKTEEILMQKQKEKRHTFARDLGQLQHDADVEITGPPVQHVRTGNQKGEYNVQGKGSPLSDEKYTRPNTITRTENMEKQLDVYGSHRHPRVTNHWCPRVTSGLPTADYRKLALAAAEVNRSCQHQKYMILRLHTIIIEHNSEGKK